MVNFVNPVTNMQSAGGGYYSYACCKNYREYLRQLL